MKLQPLLPVLLAAVLPTRADIHVVFANRLIAQGINAPVVTDYQIPGTSAPLGQVRPATGPWCMAQLWASGAPVGRPVPFRTGPLAGSIEPHIVAIPAPGVGGAVEVVMVAWFRSLGETYEEVVRQGSGGHGMSLPVYIVDAGVPVLPPTLVGLHAFAILGGGFPIPPPKPATLHATGLGDGRLGYRFTGLRSGWELAIESSTNLTHWLPYRRPWLPRGQTEFSFEVKADGPAQFFRGWQY